MPTIMIHIPSKGVEVFIENALRFQGLTFYPKSEYPVTIKYPPLDKEEKKEIYLRLQRVLETLIREVTDYGV